jgi:hypothetical protein
MAVRENCFGKFLSFSNDPENEIQIKGNSKIFGPMTSSANLLGSADSFFELGAELFFWASDIQLYWLTGPYFPIGTLGTCQGRQIFGCGKF